MEQNIALALHSPRAALHEHTLEPAESFITAEAGEIIHVQVDVTCNKEIDKAVTIIISEGSGCAKASNSDPRFFRHVFELAVSQPFVERVSAKTGNVNVQNPVIVEVGNGDSHPPTFYRQSGCFSDVGKLQVGVLMVQRHQRITALPEAIHRGPVHHKNVEFAVGIAIE